MTIPIQTTSQTDPRSSVPTSSLPNIGSPYHHHHRTSNFTNNSATVPPPPPPIAYHHHPRNDIPSYHNAPSLVSASSNNNYNSGDNTVAAAGLVTTKNNNNIKLIRSLSPPPQSNIMSKSNHHYNEENTSTMGRHIAETTANNNSSSNPPTSPSSSSGASYRPLNVIDALAYLDQVKGRFSDKPNVYNQFLDIMKDFKSQAIDTPGVIERVSTLFKGHPLLISGFNTFLPAGYRIECSIDPRDPNRIIVTTPNGNTTTSTTTTAEEMLRSEQQIPLISTRNDGYYTSNSPSHRSAIPPQEPLYNNYHHHQQHQQQSSHPLPPISSSQQYGNTTYTHPPSSSSPPPRYTTPERRPPVEFNHAINYVNRIKSRFSHNPDIYKQFLEILQTYQKEQKPIQEVYSHVQYLFNGADDLLEEFKQFLPETSNNGHHENNNSHHGLKRSISNTSSPPSASATLPTKRKKAYVTKKSKLYASGNHENNTAVDYHKKEDDLIMYTAPMSNQSSNSNSTFDPARPSVSAEEIELFDKIKKCIGNKPSYEEFLKTLNLYTQQIVTMDLLVVQVKPFFGTNKELLEAFKRAIGYEPIEHPIEKPTVQANKPDLNHCEPVEFSPSYRSVPRSWQNQPCSGRDQLCWEVLNDEYVSHPIWASEDSGFVASKKNQYEESLHRCEEERYDYDLNIEANLNTIALLEPIAARIDTMTEEEKSQMRLKPGLGGPTVSIYERIIKKVYDDERGVEIIELLYQKPATVVPVLLNRLKLKDREWKKAQREWNKIWRELDYKNYYRSLDYQGHSFKGNDRKTLATRALISEMETLQKTKGEHVFPFTDSSVFSDVAHLMFYYIDRQAGFTKDDRQRVRAFIRSFVSMFFHLDNASNEEEEGKDQTTEVTEEEEENNEGSDADGQQSNTNLSPHLNSTQKSGSPGNLRSSSTDINTGSGIAVIKTEDPDDGNANVDLVQQQQQKQKQEEENEGLSAFGTTASERRSNYTFFCNSHYYCLFRLYQAVYERLHKMKIISENIRLNPKLGKKFNQTALELDLYSNRFEEIDLSDGYYAAMLDIIDRFFEGEYDQQSFEEHVRYIFGIDAYIIFTIDKVIHSLIKQIQMVMSDRKSIEIIRLFKLESSKNITAMNYRLTVDEAIGTDENLYKFNFDMNKQKSTIQLLDRVNALEIDEPTSRESYEEYLSSYTDWSHDTKGVEKSLLKPSFLKRNLTDKSDTAIADMYAKTGLRYKIQQESYHLYYIVGSEDVIYRTKGKGLSNSNNYNQDQQKEANQKWAKWLSGHGNERFTQNARKSLRL